MCVEICAHAQGGTNVQTGVRVYGLLKAKGAVSQDEVEVVVPRIPAQAS